MLLQKFIKQWLLRLLGIIGAIVFLIVIFLLTDTKEGNLKEGNVLKRPEYGENSLEVKIKAKIEEDGIEPEELSLEVEAEKYTQDEFEFLVKESIPQLESYVLGNNISPDEITEDMIFPEKLFDMPIDIRWESDNEDVLKRTGELNEDRKEEDSIVLLTAVFSYEKYKISHTFGVMVKQKELSRQEKIAKSLFLKLEEVFEATKEEEEIVLPKEIEGIKVVYEEEELNHTKVIILFVITGILLWGIALKEEIESKELEIADLEERERKRVEEEERKRKEEEERLRREEEERKRREEELKKLGLTDQTSVDNMIWPFPGDPNIYSYFGYRTSPITGKREYHSGIDIGGAYGANIVASLAGRVTTAGYSSMNGNHVVIDHGNGVTTHYLHASKLLVSVGDYVKQGQVIMKCGSTGWSTAPHLHFTIRINGALVDPCDYVKP